MKTAYDMVGWELIAGLVMVAVIGIAGVFFGGQYIQACAMQPWCLYWLQGQNPNSKPITTVVHDVPVTAPAIASPSTGAFAVTGIPSNDQTKRIPLDQLSILLGLQSPCGVPWQVVAAIISIETGWTFDPTVANASGHVGLGQFDAATFEAATDGAPLSERTDPAVAIPAIATALCQKGWASNQTEALFRYSGGSAWYPAEVMARAASFVAVVATPDYAAIPALNQFDAANYSTNQLYLTWRAAACSAASLVWMSRAYNHPLRYIDQAIALQNADPNNPGISPSQGLLLASGVGLGQAVQRLGFPSRVGHWFVAYKSDANGIFIRESSGNDIQYLSWAQLHGTVGWSGSTVGVSSAPPLNAT